METILLIGSILSLHYPVGLFKDTARRFKRMVYYDKALEYKIQNEIPLESGIMSKYELSSETNPIFNFPFAIISFFSSFIFALFPMFKLIDYNWLIVLIINTLFSLFLAPTLAFISTPHMTINSKQQLKRKAIIFISVGILLYAITEIIR